MDGTKDLAVVLIDMQPDFLDKFNPGIVTRMVDGQRKLLTYAAREDIPVFTFEYRGYGKTIRPLRRAIHEVPRFVFYEKEYNNAFTETPLEDNLHHEGIGKIYLAGINAGACVLSTASSALTRGFTIMTSEDVIGDVHGNMRRQWYGRNGTLYSKIEDITGPIEVPDLAPQPTFFQKLSDYFQ